MEPIGYIRTDFPEKFGIPRQSGLIKELKGKIYFYPKYRNPDAFKGLDGFDYLWILWEADTHGKGWAASVKPPRLGGNTAMGVFATRSPFRPNPIGLSSVHIESVELTADGPVITVSGADLRDKTPIYDIKPYLRYTDCHEDAKDGFADSTARHLSTVFPEELLRYLPEDKRAAAIEVLSQDPRPSYQEDSERVYGVSFAGFNIRFKVDKGKATVVSVEKLG